MPLSKGSKIVKSECDKSACYVTLITEKGVADVSKYYSNIFKSIEDVSIESTAKRFYASVDKGE